MRRVLSWALLFASAGLAACTRARVTTTPSGLRYRVLQHGEGPPVRPGQQVSIHETTTLRSGAVIYSSRGSGPVTFRLGAGQVITGVDEGVTGMRRGERRVLIVPPALSRRASYPPNTPRDSTLQIEVELVAVRPE